MSKAISSSTRTEPRAGHTTCASVGSSLERAWWVPWHSAHSHLLEWRSSLLRCWAAAWRQPASGLLHQRKLCCARPHLFLVVIRIQELRDVPMSENSEGHSQVQDSPQVGWSSHRGCTTSQFLPQPNLPILPPRWWLQDCLLTSCLHVNLLPGTPAYNNECTS